MLRAKMNEVGASQLWANEWRSESPWDEERMVRRRYDLMAAQAREEYERGLLLSASQKVFVSATNVDEHREGFERRYGYVTRDQCGPG